MIWNMIRYERFKNLAYKMKMLMTFTLYDVRPRRPPRRV